MGGLASSRILEVHGERMIKRTFNPGFRIELHQKDLNLALQGAKALGVSLPNTATAQELFNACAANGGAGWDHSAMVKALELMANHPVAEDEKRSEEHTSELQSLMRLSYAVFCLKKKKHKTRNKINRKRA